MQKWIPLFTRKLSAIVFSSVFLTLLFVSCKDYTEDTRDICCNDCSRISLNYRYIRIDDDEYGTFIKTMRHFLFDEKGLFIKEIKNNSDNSQNLVISGLAAGGYSVLTIANSSVEVFNPELVEGKTELNKLRLILPKQSTGQIDDCSPLYWNLQKIVVPGKDECALKQKYICDLSNIHCRLKVTVAWESLPPGDGEYSIELSDVSTEYSLYSPDNYNLNIKDGVVHNFPFHTEVAGTHYCKKVKLFDLKLETEFRTFRYFEDRIPYISVSYKGKAITDKINLKRAFLEWGWNVNKRPEQIYNIQFTILKDGSVVLSQWFEGSVEDWQDGGSINISK